MSPVESAPSMPFGKFKNQPLRDLPGGYLAWLAGTDLHGPLAAQVAEEVARRAAPGAPEATPKRTPPDATPADLLPELLRDGEAVTFKFACSHCGRSNTFRGEVNTT